MYSRDSRKSGSGMCCFLNIPPSPQKKNSGGALKKKRKSGCERASVKKRAEAKAKAKQKNKKAKKRKILRR